MSIPVTNIDNNNSDDNNNNNRPLFTILNNQAASPRNGSNHGTLRKLYCLKVRKMIDTRLLFSIKCFVNLWNE